MPESRSTHPSELAVAVIGLGRMGGRIARRLLQTGHRVIVWNRSWDRTSQLVELGAVAALTPADAAARAALLITMVSDPAALRAVTEGPVGIGAGAGASTTVVEMSTVGPMAIARLASMLPPTTALLDAPVVGSLREAESGSLTIFAGGPRRLFDRMSPVLSELGTAIHVGPLGARAAAKLVAGAAVFDTLAALGEAVALADGLGLSRDAAYRVLAATPLAHQVDQRWDALETREHPPRFSLALARKDAHLIAEAAAASGIDVRLAAAAEAWLTESERLGLGDRDYTAMLEAILRRADVRRAGPRSVERRAPAGNGCEPDCDGLIVDLDGVVWRGGDLIDGAAEAIAALREKGARLLFLTNDPQRSRASLAERLTELGIPATPADVFTAAAAIGRLMRSLTDLAGGTAYVVGPPALQEEVRAAGLRILADEDARHADVVVVGGHDGFDHRELCAATAALRGGARLFATGRDAVVPAPDGLRPATGSILAAIETAGGARAVVVGKPAPIMFQIAREALAGCHQVGVVGDHLIADIAGAKRAGLRAILVLTGVAVRGDLDRSAIEPDSVFESLAAFADARSSPHAATVSRRRRLDGAAPV